MNLRCLFGHKWNGCKCEKCGEVRAEGHNYIITPKCKEECTICGRVTNKKRHSWDGCKCSNCGKIRTEGHNYTAVPGKCMKKCDICGSSRNLDHKFSLVPNKCEEQCEVCGETKTSHEIAGGECIRCGAKELWTPTNPRLSSNMPLSSLVRIFLFTDGDGKTVVSCPVASGTLADTAGAPLDAFLGKVPFDIVARSNVGTEIIQTGQFPSSAWIAMSRIDASATGKAQTGVYKSVVRPAKNPATGETSCSVLIYSK